MSDFGFKASKQNIDVFTALAEQLLASSSYANFIVVQEGGGTAPSGSGDQIIAINNTLDYPSVFYVWEKAGFKPNSWRCNYKSYIDANDSMKLKLVIPAGVDYYYMITNRRLDNTPSNLKPNTEDYGFKMSKPGVDVKNAKWDELQFISTKRHLQVLGKVVCSYDSEFIDGFEGYIQLPNTYYEVSSPHNKPYIPLFRDVCSILHGTNLPFVVGYGIGPSELQVSLLSGLNIANVEICVDATNVYMRWKSTYGLQSIVFGIYQIGITTVRGVVWIIGGIPS